MTLTDRTLRLALASPEGGEIWCVHLASRCKLNPFPARLMAGEQGESVPRTIDDYANTVRTGLGNITYALLFPPDIPSPLGYPKAATATIPLENIT